MDIGDEADVLACTVNSREFNALNSKAKGSNTRIVTHPDLKIPFRTSKPLGSGSISPCVILKGDRTISSHGDNVDNS